MGIFGAISSRSRMSQAAVVVQNLLELQAKGGLIDRNPAALANRLVSDVWEDKPDIFDGKFGQRPHKLAVAAIALANGMKTFTHDESLKAGLFVALGEILKEVNINGRLYPFNSLDAELFTGSSVEFSIEAEKADESLSILENVARSQINMGSKESADQEHRMGGSQQGRENESDFDSFVTKMAGARPVDASSREVLSKTALVIEMQLMLCRDTRDFEGRLDSDFVRGYFFGIFDAAMQCADISIDSDQDFVLLLVAGHSCLMSGSNKDAAIFVLDSLARQDREHFILAKRQAGKEYFEFQNGRVRQMVGLMRYFQEGA